MAETPAAARQRMTALGWPPAAIEVILEQKATISATIKVAEQAVFAAINLLIDRGLWCGPEKDDLLYHVYALRKHKEMYCAQDARQHLAEQGSHPSGPGEAALVHTCGWEDGVAGLNPRPLSRIESVMTVVRFLITTAASVAAECLTTFVTASCTMR